MKLDNVGLEQKNREQNQFQERHLIYEYLSSSSSNTFYCLVNERITSTICG